MRIGAVLDRRKILLNGIVVRRIGRQKQKRMSSLKNQLTGQRRFMKGRIVHDEDRLRGELLEEMRLQPSSEPLGIRIPLTQHRSQQSLSTFPRNQTRAQSGIPTPLARDPVSSAGPALGAMSRRLKPTFIQINDSC